MKLRIIANVDLRYLLYSPSREVFYTGKSGGAWIGSKDQAYTMTKEGAESQRVTFNKPETAFAIKDWIVVPA